MPEGYFGVCSICGHRGYFDVADAARPRDQEFACAACGRALRARDEAQVLIDEYGDGRQEILDELLALRWFRSLAVYHVGSIGAVRKCLRQLDRYVESRYEPDQPRGHPLDDGFVNQDLTALTFADQSFDLVYSSHVMEHVPDPWLAFREIHRVLRPGGRMIHSIPTRYPLQETTTVRAELVDGEIRHHRKEQYHKSPEGVPALVFSDLGADLKPRLDAIGLETSLRRPHLQIDGARRNLVLVARRVG